MADVVDPVEVVGLPGRCHELGFATNGVPQDGDVTFHYRIFRTGDLEIWARARSDGDIGTNELAGRLLNCLGEAGKGCPPRVTANGGRLVPPCRRVVPVQSDDAGHRLSCRPNGFIGYEPT